MALPDVLDLLIALETELHSTSTRSDRARLKALLHADFEEVGRSGVHYRRDDVLAALPEEAADTTIEADGFRIAMQSDALVLLTYRSARRGADGNFVAHTLRSSLWQKAEDHWQMRFHQGTPTAPFTMKKKPPRGR